MDITRRNFLGTAAMFTAAAGLRGENVPAATAFDPSAYAALRKQLRAFYPDECHGVVKDPRQPESEKKIAAEVRAWADAHPGFDALDIRRESYRAMTRHFVPFLFTESPFYFEAGVNGGWSGARPARVVNAICGRFYKEKSLIPGEAFRLLKKRNGERLALCCGPFVDDMHHVPPIRAVLAKGFGGIRADVAAALGTCPKDDPYGRKMLETAQAGLDTLRDLQLAFAREAQKRLEDPALDATGRRYFTRIAESAQRCPWEPPKTFFEGLNTLWFIREILGYTDGVWLYSLGRPDAWLYDLYRADLAAGRLTEAEAADLAARFLITADCHHDGMIPVNSSADHEMEIPMSLGGCDKHGKPVYNELTRLFLDAHIGTDCVFPKLHCRIASDAPQAYLAKIGDMLMKGHAVFALLNDDRYIPQYVRQGFPVEDAREYTGVGCWNGYIDSVMDVDGANYVSVMRTFELAIHRDPKVEQEARIRIDPIDGASSFEEVRNIAYRNFIRFFRDVMSEYTRYGAQNAKVFPHPTYTMCLRGGIQSRRDTTEGGIPARPRVVTLGFIGNVVDSLLAIRHLCFDTKTCTLPELLAAVRDNWSGPRGEALRKAALDGPYWGDGSALTCGEMAWWMRRVHDDIEGFANDQGDAYRLAVYTYREFMYWGNATRATPDGRRDGDRLAQGFSPSEYRCKEGVTTVLNAIGMLPHECLFASNANLTFDKTAMSPETFAAVFRVYAKKCGHLLQPNCNSVEQLLEAQQHPERYQHLIVKVCGFSARFVALSKRWQDEVIARHRLK